jgi:hypothetical protein
VTGKSPVKVQLEIDIFFLGELHVVYMDQWGVQCIVGIIMALRTLPWGVPALTGESSAYSV